MQPLEVSSSAVGSSSLLSTSAGKLEAAAAARSVSVDLFGQGASPVPGRMELPSRTELLGAGRGAAELGAAGGSGSVGSVMEAEIVALRRSLEDTRAVARELQRQQRQDTRWHGEMESTVEGLKAKLGAAASREAMEALAQELRSYTDRRHREAIQDFGRRAQAFESALENARSTTSTDVSGLRGELGDFMAMLGKSNGDERPSQSHSSFQGLAERHVDARISALEQQASKVSVQLASLAAQPSQHRGEGDSAAADGAARRAEAAERKASTLEVSLERLQERCNKLAQELQSLRDAAEGERERGVHYLQGLEELRERNTAGISASAAHFAALDASVQADRLRFDDESRALQRSVRDLEQRISTGSSNSEQLVAEAKAAAGATVAEALAEAESRGEVGRQRLIEQIQQLSTRLRKAEDAAASTEAAAGGGIAAVLERVGRLEVATTDDTVNYERLERRMEERISEVKMSIESERERCNMDAQSSLTSRLQVQRADAERRIEQLTREIRSVASTIEAVQDVQRRQSQNMDVGHAGQLDEAERTAGRAEKLRQRVDELDRKLQSLEPDLRSDLDKLLLKLQELEPQLPRVDSQVQSLESGLTELGQQVGQQIRQCEQRFRTVELLEPAVKELEPRLKGLEAFTTRYESQLTDFDVRMREFEPRLREIEPQLREMTKLEPRLRDIERASAIVEPRIRELEPRIEKVREQQEARLREFEPLIRELEPRIREVESRSRELELHTPEMRELECRVRDLEDHEPRLRELVDSAMEQVQPLKQQVQQHTQQQLQHHSQLHMQHQQYQQLEPRLQALEPLIQLVKDLQVWQLQAEPSVKKLECRADSMQQSVQALEKVLETNASELKNLDSLVKEFDMRSRYFVEHKITEAKSQVKDDCTSLQKSLEGQISDCLTSIRTDSSAWRDALRSESVAWREACTSMRNQTDSIREELHRSILEVQDLADRSLTEVRGESTTEIKEARAREEKLAEGINELRAMLMRQMDETDAKLSQTLHEFSWRMGQRVDEADASAGEARAAVTELDRALGTIRQQVEKDKQEAAKELMRILDLHAQATVQQAQTQAVAQAAAQAVSQATDSFKCKLDEASKVSEESARQTTRALAEISDIERDLGRKFDRWSAQAHETAQTRLQDIARTSLSELVASAERQSEKFARQAHAELQVEAKEEARKLKEEMCSAAHEASNHTDRALADLQRRLETFIGETSATVRALSSEAARLDSQDVEQHARLQQLEKHEAAGREALEHSVASVRRGFEQERARVTELCERVFPGLRDLQGAIVEEQQTRGEETRRAQERMREWEDKADAQQAAQRRAEAMNRGLADALRNCESAVAVADKRIAGLEESLEDRMHDWITGEVTQNVLQQLESQQRGQIVDMQGKMDKIIRNLHTPSGHGASFGTAQRDESAGDREMWRQRFRSSLGDSLYVKKSLQRGCRAPSADSLRCRGGGLRGGS